VAGQLAASQEGLSSANKYKNSVRTSQEAHYVSATKSNRLVLFWETVAVYCENHTEHTDTLCVDIMQSFSVLKQVVQIRTTGLSRLNTITCISSTRQRLVKHVPEGYAVNKHEWPLLAHGFCYHGTEHVSGTTHT
jgi:hypothetical protein